MAVPSIASVGTNNSGGSAVTTLNVTNASGLTSGDLCVIIATNDNITDTAQFDDTTYNVREQSGGADAGFTFIQTAGSSAPDAFVAAWYKEITGSDSLSWRVDAQSTDNMCVVCLRITGFKIGAPLDATGAAEENGSNTNHAWTSTMSATGNSLILHASSYDGGDTSPFSLDGSSTTAGWSITADVTCGNFSDRGACMVAENSSHSATGTIPQLDSNTSVADGAAGFFFAIAEADGTISANLASLTLTTYAADVRTGTNVDVSTAFLNVTPFQASITADTVIPPGKQGQTLNIVASDSILYGLYDPGDVWITDPQTDGGYNITLTNDGHFVIDAGGDGTRQQFVHDVYDASAGSLDGEGTVSVNNNAPRLISGDSTYFGEDGELLLRGENYSYNVIGESFDVEDDTFTATISAGSLPPGMSMNNGILSGKPSKTGTYSFTLTLTDSVGDTQNFSESMIVLPNENVGVGSSSKGVIFYVTIDGERIGFKTIDEAEEALERYERFVNTPRRIKRIITEKIKLDLDSFPMNERKRYVQKAIDVDKEAGERIRYAQRQVKSNQPELKDRQRFKQRDRQEPSTLEKILRKREK